MPLVAVIAVLGRRLDVALALAAKLPRLALDGFFSLLRCHSVSPMDKVINNHGQR